VQLLLALALGRKTLGDHVLLSPVNSIEFYRRPTLFAIEPEHLVYVHSMTEAWRDVNAVTERMGIVGSERLGEEAGHALGHEWPNRKRYGRGWTPAEKQPRHFLPSCLC